MYQNQHLRESDAVKFLSSFPDIESFIDAVDEVDGQFTVIIQKGSRLMIAVDRMRTFPLFYNQTGDVVYITDDPYLFQNEVHLNHNNIDEFLLTGFSSGRRTLMENVFQTLAAEVIVFENEQTSFHRYYTHKTTEVISDSFETLAVRLHNLLFSVFKDFVKTLDGRPVALSLSGGYDSRLIAFMLRHFNYENVLCFTYGRAGNEELQNSRMSAEQLGYEWRFIAYNEELAKNYLRSPEFGAYVKFAGKMSSMPFLVDYFAVQFLKEQKLVDEDTIFLCGHSGDSVAGSHLKGIFTPQDGPKKVVDTVYQSYYNLSRLRTKDKYYQKLKKEIDNQTHLAYSVFEDWVLSERQAKFIVNAACVYDFFGYEYQMPLWDMRLLKYFRRIPLEYKNYKLLYDHVLRKIFQEKGIDFDTELQPSNRTIQIQKVKNRIKKMLPLSVVKRFQKKDPWDAYDILTAPMAAELEGTEYEEQCGIEYNSVICNWYVKELREATSQRTFP